MSMMIDLQTLKWLRPGYSADPGPDILLDKSKIARLKVRQLEMVVHELEGQLEMAKMELDMIREEYKI